jgi:hypothetical protein
MIILNFFLFFAFLKYKKNVFEKKLYLFNWYYSQLPLTPPPPPPPQETPIDDFPFKPLNETEIFNKILINNKNMLLLKQMQTQPSTPLYHHPPFHNNGFQYQPNNLKNGLFKEWEWDL